jgi:hypothetical protein
LIILQNSHKGPANGKAGAVEGVDILGSLLALPFEPDICPPSLEILEV